MADEESKQLATSPEDTGNTEPSAENETEEQPEAPAGDSNSKGGRLASAAKSSFMKRNKTKLIVGGLFGGVGIGGIALLIFFLLLFKNIHIKELFISYEFAKFNRGFSKRISMMVNETKANTPRQSASVDTPEARLAEVKTKAPAQIAELEQNPKSLRQAIREMVSLDQSKAGTGGKVARALGLSRSVPKAAGQNDEEVKKTTKEKIKTEIDGKETLKDSPLDGIDDANRELQEEAKKPGATNEGLTGASESSQATRRMGAKFFSGVQALSGPFVIATFSCIAKEIFDLGWETYTSIKMSGLAQVATTQAKFADCQALGDCTAAQIAAIAEQADNGTESFTQSAGYKRAAGEPVTADTPDLEEKFKPSFKPSGPIEGLLHIANTVLDASVTIPLPPLPPKFEARSITLRVCDIVLDTRTQYLFAITNILSTAAGVASGTVSFGLGTVATAAGQTAAQIFATKAGTALAVHTASHYGGMLFKGEFSPIQWGNMLGAGNKVLASSTCQLNGCRQLTSSENQTVATAIRAERIKTDQERGLAWRLFGKENPHSVLALTLYKTPTTPKAMLASSAKTLMAALSPGKLFGGLARINPVSSVAYADTVESNTYGIPDYGFTDAELDKYEVVENSRWVEQNILANPNTKEKYDKCFDSGLVEVLGDGRDGKDLKYSYCNDSNDQTLLRYRLFKLDQSASNGLNLLMQAKQANAQ